MGGKTFGEFQTALLAELKHQQGRLQALRSGGAKTCQPGHLQAGRLLSQRITREIYGGLLVEAKNGLALLQRKVDAMEQRLAFLARHTGCVVSGADSSHEQRPFIKQNRAGLAPIRKVKDWTHGFRKIKPAAWKAPKP